MARIRSIKPELWSSEKLGRMKALSRLTFIGLISLADDSGRGRGDPRYMLGALHGYASDIDERTFSAALRELESKQIAAFYVVNEGHYYALPGWSEHQYIEKPKASKFPSVPDDHPLASLFKKDEEGTRRGRGGDEEGISRLRKGREGKGKERKGKECPATECVGFTEFWTTYPRKEGKKDAEREWSKLDVALHPVILADVKKRTMSADWQKDGGKFIPHASTYLHGARWEDRGVQLPMGKSQDDLEFEKKLKASQNGGY